LHNWLPVPAGAPGSRPSTLDLAAASPIDVSRLIPEQTGRPPLLQPAPGRQCSRHASRGQGFGLSKESALDLADPVRSGLEVRMMIRWWHQTVVFEVLWRVVDCEYRRKVEDCLSSVFSPGPESGVTALEDDGCGLLESHPPRALEQQRWYGVVDLVLVVAECWKAMLSFSAG
jgi:hypothetical protein